MSKGNRNNRNDKYGVTYLGDKSWGWFKNEEGTWEFDAECQVPIMTNIISELEYFTCEYCKFIVAGTGAGPWALVIFHQIIEHKNEFVLDEIAAMEMCDEPDCLLHRMGVNEKLELATEYACKVINVHPDDISPLTQAELIHQEFKRISNDLLTIIFKRVYEAGRRQGLTLTPDQAWREIVVIGEMNQRMAIEEELNSSDNSDNSSIGSDPNMN